ncbi:MAG: hypothetical protein AAF655_18350 [Bacteroidota bacterium]
MNARKKRWVLLAFWGCIFVLFLQPFSYGQINNEERIGRLKKTLDSLANVIPGLAEETHLQLKDVPLHEYVRAIGLEHKVNVYIADTPDLDMTINLNRAPVKYVFLFICKTYSYTLDITGNIIRFKPLGTFVQEPSKPKSLSIQYDAGLLAYDLKNDSLGQVIRKISMLSGQRIVTKPGVKGVVSGYSPPTALEKSLEMLFIGNGYRLSKSRKGYFVVSPTSNSGLAEATAEPVSQQARRNNNPGRKPANPPQTKGRTDFLVEVFSDGTHEFLSIDARDADLEELVETIFDETQSDYFIFEQLEGSVTVQLDSGSLENVLKYVFQGTPYTYKKDEGLFLVGSKELEGLRSTAIVKLKYRPSAQAIELIPPKSVEDIEILEYPELNRIILRGPTEKVRDTEYFLNEIDRPIPMVKIEMIVVEVEKSKFISTGIRAGLRQAGDSLVSTKQVLPGIDYTLTGPQVNDIFDNAGIPFLGTLGRLSSSFYIQLRAQESQGNLKVKMKPVLSMLNGREATLTIGQTQYYLLDTQTASNGAVNSFQQFTQRFEKIEANINLTIKPYISDDDMVTLDIAPDFTNPIGTFDSNVPPTISTRKFDSTIRVRNEETVILGGLSNEEVSESGSGVPFLSRIPILKWLFSSREKSKVDSSLIIYITPVIYYN